MIFYESVFKAFNKAKIDYVVFGGVAAVLYGVHRTTMDLDVMIKMTPKNIDRLFGALHRLGYRPKLPISIEEFKDARRRKIWVKEKNMLVFAFIHKNDPLKIVDIAIYDFIKYSVIKKERMKLGDFYIPVISLAQLKKLKKKANRQQDLVDLDDLRRLLVFS